MTPRTCPNCGVETTTVGEHCPACGFMYRRAAAVTPAVGCASAFGGAVVGLFAAILLATLLLSATNGSNTILSIALAVADAAAIGLTVRVIWVARHGTFTAASPFLVAFAVVFAGALTTCAGILYSIASNGGIH